MPMKFSVVATSCALLLLLSGTAAAQGIQGIPGDQGQRFQNRGAYYEYAEPGDITISVSVWGNAEYPGYYILPEDMRLNEVLSMAGGAREPALLTSRRRRQTTVLLSRLVSPNERRIIFEADFTDVTSTGDYPVLQNDDVIYVETIETERFNWRDLATVSSLALGVVNIILQVQNLRDNN